MEDEKLLDRFQKAAFGYFMKYVNRENGLVPDTSREGSPASIAVVGFGLSAYPVAVERGWMKRVDAISLTLATLRFFHDSPQSEQPNVTGYKGFYYHFLDMKTGLRTWACELSLIDSAILLAGMLVAACYFSRMTDDEKEIRDLVTKLYDRVDWEWAQNGGPTLSQGWKPEFGFMHRGWEGYNEATILYILGSASATHPLTDKSYSAWTLTYQWENIYGYDALYAGPLFVHQFSHAWIDFRDIRDDFMREKNFDYFRNSQHAVYIQSIYTDNNPYGFAGYNRDLWGLSAGDGPGGHLLNIEQQDRRCFIYAARGVPYGPDDGTIAPAAIMASLPFAPEIVMPAVHHIMQSYPAVIQDYRFPGGFNPTAAGPDGKPWISEGLYGLDQGLIVLMIENYRSQMIWNLMRGCRTLQTGLLNAGFRGGWLEKET